MFSVIYSRGMDCNWSDGRTWGFVYNGDPDHVKLMNEVYTLFSQTNPLHTTAFPSVHRMEQEVHIEYCLLGFSFPPSSTHTLRFFTLIYLTLCVDNFHRLFA